MVTGGNSGIGFALCRQLAASEEYDCKVYLAARNRKRGQEAIERILKRHSNADIELLVMDVSSELSVRAAAEKLSLISFYAIVNNAGVGIRTGDGNPDNLLATNIYGPKRVIDAFLPQVTHRIVNISSGAAAVWLRNEPPQTKAFFSESLTEWHQLVGEVERQKILNKGGGISTYCISKAALNLYTMQLAEEHSHLTIVAVTPGMTDTNLTRGLNDGKKQQPDQATAAILKCLFSDNIRSGAYYGSDGLRSPLTVTRDPGMPEYEGEDEGCIDPSRYNK